jgi:hypothetical protein
MKTIIGRAARQSKAILQGAVAVLLALLPAVALASDRPRVAAVSWGKTATGDEVAQLARFGMVFAGLPSSKPKVQPYLDSLRAANPEIKLGSYTVLVEYWQDVSPGDRYKRPQFEAIEANDWWVRDASGQRMSWTSAYGTRLVNITEWAPTDRAGRRYPQWLAQHLADRLGGLRGLDYLFIDNFWYSPRPRNGNMDWRRAGSNQSNEDDRIRTAYRQGLADFVDALRVSLPGTKLIGNADNDLDYLEFRGKLDGANMECAMGKRWSPETRYGWDRMMTIYRSMLKHTRGKGDVVLGVCSENGVDLKLLRYGLASAMLNDGWFSYRVAGAKALFYADEYGAQIGQPIEPPPTKAHVAGAWQRSYSGGLVIVNPTDYPVRVSVGKNYKRILGRQDSLTNSGKAESNVIVPSKDGLILVKVGN